MTTQSTLLLSACVLLLAATAQAESECRSASIPNSGNQGASVLRLCSVRTDNGERLVRLTFREEWTLSIEAACPAAASPPLVAWRNEKNWSAHALTVGPRRTWLWPSADGKSAIIVLGWEEVAGDIGGDIAVDVYRVVLHESDAAELPASAEPFARLRRPMKNHMRISDILFGTTALTVLVTDPVIAPREYRLDLESGGWHEATVASEAVPGVVDWVTSPRDGTFSPSRWPPPTTDPPADAPPPR